MPRMPRSEIVDGMTHVTTRGNRRKIIFPTALDYYEHLLLVDETMKRHRDVICHGFCLMPNHFHLVVDGPQTQLSELMHRINGVYAQRFNRRYAVNGHLFQGRFGTEPIRNEPHLLEVVRYVVLNPVRAHICADAAAWPWSSYNAYLDRRARPPFVEIDFVLDLFAPHPERALREFVADGMSRYPKPYVPGNFSARRRTRSAPGRPTTFR